MRLLYPVTWARLTRQASQMQAVATAAALARQGCAVTLLLPRGPTDPELTPAHLRAWFDVESDFRVVQEPSRWQGDAILPTALWLRQVFASPEVREADLLYSRIPLMFGAGQLSPRPFATDHYRPWPDVYPVIRPLVRRSTLNSRCLGLVIHSDYAAAAYRRAGVPEDRILVAHNGFDPLGSVPTKEAARALLGLPSDRPIALYAGRINAEKGLDAVLALAALRPDVLFVLVGSEGDGPIERAAASRANVRIFPWVEPAAVPAWLAAADVLLIPPSRAPLEKFGNCVLPIKLYAYLTAGRPILAPESPDTAELLEHRANSWLVPPDDADSAAAGLDRLLADGALAAKLSANALRLSEGLTWDQRARKIAEFLQARL